MKHHTTEISGLRAQGDCVLKFCVVFRLTKHETRKLRLETNWLQGEVSERSLSAVTLIEQETET